MKTADLYSLQALRQLREQRASSRLAAQQERCRETRSELDQARDALQAHRDKLAREAEDVFGRFSEGLSVSAWRAAQEELQRLESEGEQLQAQTDTAGRNVENEEQLRQQLRQEHLSHQQKTAAWGTLVERRVRHDARIGEQRDEADALPATGPGGPE
jgi:flagellar biosynthesis chaperone FliJ